jgi:hypothetical protein
MVTQSQKDGGSLHFVCLKAVFFSVKVGVHAVLRLLCIQFNCMYTVDKQHIV